VDIDGGKTASGVISLRFRFASAVGGPGNGAEVTDEDCSVFAFGTPPSVELSIIVHEETLLGKVSYCSIIDGLSTIHSSLLYKDEPM
jgi:hypothetical protein